MADISGSLLARKIANIEATGADTVVATDISCLLHIGGGLRRQGSSVQVKHLAELLADEGRGTRDEGRNDERAG
jgi:L-lactate dehydrogenase complex protein LldE